MLLPDLTNKRVLIVEDEYFVAEEMERDFMSYGAEVVGPVPSLAQAVDIVASQQPLDGAVLDINLLGDHVYPLANVLMKRGVPCVFASGYDRYAVPEAYRNVPHCEKPVDTARIAWALFPSS